MNLKVGIFQKRLVLSVVILFVIVVMWFSFNPSGEFGICFFGVTTFNYVPMVIKDLQVNSEGDVRTVEKTHKISFKNIEWLLQPTPEVLIISVGWKGLLTPEGKILGMGQIPVMILKTGEAIIMYNKLKTEGKRVAIHLHSTC